MIGQLRDAPKQDGTMQESARDAACLTERLHRLAAYWALAVIAAIVFGPGAFRF